MLGFLILLFCLLLLHKPHLIFCLLLLDFWPSNVDQLVHRATRECLGFVVENKNIAIFLRENIWNWRFISIHGTYRFPVWGSPWSRGFPDSGSSRFSWLSAPATCQSARQWKPTMLRGILIGIYLVSIRCPCQGMTRRDVFRMTIVCCVLLILLHSLLNGCWMITAFKDVKPHRAKFYDVRSMHGDARSLKLINLPARHEHTLKSSLCFSQSSW